MKHYYYVYYNGATVIKCVLHKTSLNVLTAAAAIQQLRRYLHAQVKP